MENLRKIYEYKFEKIKAGFFEDQKTEKDYRSIIQEYSEEGWRFVQIFVAINPGLGIGTKYYEMIFERKKAEE